MQHYYDTSEDNYLNLDLVEEDHLDDYYSQLEFDVIWENQELEGRSKLYEGNVREASLNPFAQPPHILKAREVVLWTPSYRRVIITTGVLDRNGEITVQTEDGTFEGVQTSKLLWVEHFSRSSPIGHNLRRCTVEARNAERFTGSAR